LGLIGGYLSRERILRSMLRNRMETLRDRYMDVYAEAHDRDEYYEIIVYCPYARDDGWMKKTKILNNHLLIYIGVTANEYIIYVPIPEDAGKILNWKIKNGLIYVEIGKTVKS